MDYLNKKEGFNKRDLQEINQSLAKQIEIEDKKNTQIHYENFYTTSKPVSLKEARVKNKLDKTIEGHIIVCGIVKGIKNLILPLRSRF
jgi:tRNA A37 N6-isopentenylltransferase MiaA